MNIPDIPKAWVDLFTDLYTRKDFEELRLRVEAAYLREQVLPPKEQIFSALEFVPPEKTKVVILGQDPYPTRGRAHGLSFSVLEPNPPPPSLKNIFGELERSIPGWKRPCGGNLEPWARQGVLMLNTILTVREGEPLSHADLGWEDFSRAVIRHVQLKSPFVVFLLWGAKAQSIGARLIDSSMHKALSCSHPSPMAQNRLPPSERFIGNNHFVQTNNELQNAGRAAIIWNLP